MTRLTTLWPEIETIDAPSISVAYGAATALDAEINSATESWLTPREDRRLDRWRNGDRRRQSLRARWLIKQQALRCFSGVRLPEIEIDSDGSGRPMLVVAGRRFPVSISHTASAVLVALGTQDDLAVGVDLTPLGHLARHFIRLWFTPAEQLWLAGAEDPHAGNRLWATKEAIYKAVNRGEPFDPLKVVALPSHAEYCGRKLEFTELKSWTVDNHAAVLVAISALR